MTKYDYIENLTRWFMIEFGHVEDLGCLMIAIDMMLFVLNLVM